jgi:hypothetical protein
LDEERLAELLTAILRTVDSDRPPARKRDDLRALPRRYRDRADCKWEERRLGVPTLSPMTGRDTDALDDVALPSRCLASHGRLRGT